MVKISGARLWGQSSSLALLADHLELSNRTIVHPTYYPFGYLLLAHAIRVSHGTRRIGGGRSSQLSVFQSFLLNQILIFGGVILSGILLGIPNPVMYSEQFIVLYGGTHVFLFVTGLGDILLRLQENWAVGLTMDLCFTVFDGFTRSDGCVDLGIDFVRKHPSPVMAASNFAAIVNGAIMGGAVTIMIDMFKLDSKTGDWGLRTPISFKNPLAGTTDVWSAALVSWLYIALTDKQLGLKTYRFISTYAGPLTGLLPSVGDGVTIREARTICGIVLGLILTLERLNRLSAELSSTSSNKALPPPPTPSKPRLNGFSSPNGSASSKKTKKAK